ncbi:hypothetical protein K0M31_014458 [Melipona bicolor]|uniref:Uncharacterized protein n=1 Tax=Melipona bicolor TaxID=60889 RepID=A0AA40G8M1_9HYME|nr:hypothetical protein K0M31_014458 [Melipona bicolor]
MLEDDPLAGPTRRADSSDRCCSTTAADVTPRLAVIEAEGVGEVFVVEGIVREQTTKESDGDEGAARVAGATSGWEVGKLRGARGWRACRIRARPAEASVPPVDRDKLLTRNDSRASPYPSDQEDKEGVGLNGCLVAFARPSERP